MISSCSILTYTGAKIIQNARLLVEKIGRPLEPVCFAWLISRKLYFQDKVSKLQQLKVIFKQAVLFYYYETLL